MKVNEEQDALSSRAKSPRPAQVEGLATPRGLLTETSVAGIDEFLAEFNTMEDANRIADKLNAHDALVEAAQALLDRIDNITTDEFSRGGDRAEREALRDVLIEIAKGK